MFFGVFFFFFFFFWSITLLQKHCYPAVDVFSRPGSSELQVGVPGVGAGVVECESCHGTQSTYHAKCSRECSSGPGRPSIPGKLIVINQVTEAEQGLADDYLSPLLLLLPPSLPPLVFPSPSSSILYSVFPDAVFIQSEKEEEEEKNC